MAVLRDSKLLIAQAQFRYVNPPPGLRVLDCHVSLLLSKPIGSTRDRDDEISLSLWKHWQCSFSQPYGSHLGQIPYLC